MTRVTLRDCAACLVVSVCDAHHSYGTWKHRGGLDPCILNAEDAPAGGDHELGFC